MSTQRPTKDELVEEIYQYIQDRELNPWEFTDRGATVPYDDWPIQLQDVIKEEEVEFDPDTLKCTIEAFREERKNGYRLRRRGASGGDYIDFRQIFALSGDVVFEVTNDEFYQLDTEKTTLDYEIEFEITGSSSY